MGRRRELLPVILLGSFLVGSYCSCIYVSMICMLKVIVELITTLHCVTLVTFEGNT